MSSPLSETRALVSGIPRRSDQERLQDPVSYAALRAAALDYSQAASGKRWTDYNIHDPGVTLLEAACYALTELDYPLDLAVADFLCGPDGTIDQHRQGLFAAPRILPSAAITVHDICQVILDADPAILDARLSAGGDGLQSLSILADTSLNSDLDNRTSRRLALLAYHAHRALGEDLEDEVGTIEVEYCQLVLDAWMTGARDQTEIIAEIFEVCDELLSQRLKGHGRAALMAIGHSFEQIYDGPLIRSGPIELADGAVNDRMISASAFRSRIGEIRGLGKINELDFRFQLRPRTDGANFWDGRLMKWDASKCAPRMVTPLDNPSESLRFVKLRIPAGRRDMRDRSQTGSGTGPANHFAATAARYEDFSARRNQRSLPDHAIDLPGDALPRGNALRALNYRPVGNLLPPVYGLTDIDRPPGSSPPSQLAAYLALTDQLLVNSAGLVTHLGELFSSHVADAHGTPAPSYWPTVLTDEQIPGIEQLYRAVAPETDGNSDRQNLLAEIRRATFDQRDQAWVRRNRILDFMLALYGEQLDQRLFRTFLDYLDFPEIATDLLHVKSRYLSRIDILTRDRAAGRNIALPPWSSGATGGFAERIALKLGFANPEARRLARREGKTNLITDFQPGPRSDRHKLDWPASGAPPIIPSGGGPIFDDLEAGKALPSALLSHGLDRRNYCYAEKRLLLDAGNDGGAIDLGRWSNRAAAGLAAHALRQKLLEQVRAAEGLHVVEHILLRHRAEPQASPELALRVTVVLPRWTARTARHDFQAFAEALIRSECPAHLVTSCLWLDHREMATFEEHLQRWQQALADYVSGRAGADKVDPASERVLNLLRNHQANRS